MSLPSSATDACARARERVSLRADGELSLLETVSLRAHLRVCGGCRVYAADVERIVGELRSAPMEVPEFDVAMPRRRYRSFGALVPAAVAAAAVAALLVHGNFQPFSPGTVGTGSPRVHSNGASLHAAYNERRLARLFLNRHLVTHRNATRGMR